jgi:FkbM family methyltransferase
VWRSPHTLISTIFGKFRVREGTQDAAIVSPAFERADVDRLMALTRRLLDEGKRVLFLDAGANIGKFSVSLLHCFSGRPIRAVAIEPSPANLELLVENRRLNALEREMQIVPSAVHERAGTMTLSFDPLSCGRSTLGTIDYECDVQKVEVPVIRIDDLDLRPLESEVLVIKIDIEGFEIPALEGAAETLERFREIYVMTEDTTNTEDIYAFLGKAGFVRLWRVTPYNSCWMRKR